MAELDDTKVRDLAYQLWEQDGRPDGKDHHYWHAAARLLADEGEITDADDPVASLAIPAVVAPKIVK